MSGKLAFCGLSFVRKAHTGTPQVSPRIYNTPVHAEVMKNWKPQTPNGPTHDGWALKRWPFKVGNQYAFFVKSLIYLSTGFWAPFLVVQYQLTKANAGK